MTTCSSVESNNVFEKCLKISHQTLVQPPGKAEKAFSSHTSIEVLEKKPDEQSYTSDPMLLPREEKEILTASSKKLSQVTNQEGAGSCGSTTTLVDLDCLSSLLRSVPCSHCMEGHIQLEHCKEVDYGYAVSLRVLCTNCGFVFSQGFTSKRKGRGSFDVNKRAVASSLITGIGHAGLQNFSEMMNMPSMSSRTFSKLASLVQMEGATFCGNMLQQGVATVHKTYKRVYPELRDRDILDISVSYDGSWQTRGHHSKNGVGCVIDELTGLVVDFHCMSRHCNACTIAKGKDDFAKWKKEHDASGSCNQNFEGSSAAMEVEGARVCWGRSIAKNRLRYTSILSDGDCRTYNFLCSNRPYGPDVDIVKEECVNHVSKRLGTALRKLVVEHRSRGTTLGGRGKGHLTEKKILKLTQYYAKAIRGTSNTTDMRSAIMASLYHCMSTDQSPQHSFCLDSWCFYQRDIANHATLRSHSQMTKTALDYSLLHDKLLPIYEWLSSEDLLQRCLKHRTQNANESLHSMIWAKCPKVTVVCNRRLNLGVTLAVAEFNMGSFGRQQFMKHLLMAPGKHMVEVGRQKDNVRLRKAKYRVREMEESYRKKRRLAEIEEHRILVQREGPSYGAGEF